jgi:LmbE family N-acetylglucosaminyl deacetylase
MGENQKKVILGVGAHPDDMDFTSSGTFAKFAEEGHDCYYLVCTDGSRGSSDSEMTHQKLAEIRREEQIEAGKILGLKDIFFLDHMDTQLSCDQKLREDIVAVIRKIKPDIVITWDPTCVYVLQSPWGEGSFVNHSDHRACGQATMDACFPYARDRLTYPQHEAAGLKPHSVKELWMVAFETQNHIVDITDTFEKKWQAICAHKSQFEDVEGTKKRVIRRAETFGKDKGYKYAEGFIRLLLD